MPLHTSNPASAVRAETGPGVLRLGAEDTQEKADSLFDLQVVRSRQLFRVSPTIARVLAGSVFESRSA